MADKSTAIRNSQADRLVANLDGIELLDASSNVIATGTVSGWASATAGEVKPSSDVSLTGTAAAGTGSNGTDAATARFFDTGATGEEVSGMTVTGTGGGGDIELVNTNITEGQPITLPASDVGITEPATTQ